MSEFSARLAQSIRLRLPGELTALAVVLAASGLLVHRVDRLTQAAIAVTFATAASGLGLALGSAGQYLLGQGAVFATGAYTTAILTVHGWNFWFAALAGAAVSTLAGLAISLAGLRVSYFYFAMIGFFLVFLIPDVVQILQKETGGTAGLAIPDHPALVGHKLGVRGMFFLASGGLLASLLVIRNLKRSPVGVVLPRMRDNAVTLGATGMSLWRARLATYVVSSSVAGIAGAIYSHINGYIQPGEFDLTQTILLFAAVLVGGSTRLLGPTLGIVLLYVIPRILIDIQGYADLVYGATVLLAAIAFRRGVIQAFEDALRGSSVARQRLKGTRENADTVVDSDRTRLANMLLQLRPSLRAEAGALVARGVRKSFGGNDAVALEPSEEIRVEPGDIHLLLGPNGSGKTVLLNILAGLIRSEAGVVEYATADISRVPAWRRARKGLSRSFQTPVLPAELTAVEALTGRCEQLSKVSYLEWMLSLPRARRARRDAIVFSRQVLASAGLAEMADRPCSELTSGQRRVLDVLLALCSRAHVALLDEPAAGLSDSERHLFSETLLRLADAGMGFLVVEHDLALAMGMATKATVLAAGRIVDSGTPAEVQKSPAVRAVLLGESSADGAEVEPWTASV